MSAPVQSSPSPRAYAMMVSKAQEAERRANGDLVVIFRELGVEEKFNVCPGTMERWAQLSGIVAGIKKAGLDAVATKNILRARMVTRLVRYVIDFRCFATRGEVAPLRGDQIISVAPYWSWATSVLADLIDLVHESSIPESLEVLKEYRRLGRKLVRAYSDTPVFWWEEGEAPWDPILTQQRLKCLRTLWALVHDSPRGELCTVIHASNAVYIVLPLFARLRQSIRTTPNDNSTLFYAMQSARALHECVQTLSSLKLQDRPNLEELTGTSYFELIRQCLTCEGHEVSDVGNRMLHLDLISAMIEYDHSLGLQDVIISRNVITWTVSFVRLLTSRYNKHVPVIRGPPGSPLVFDWYDRAIRMLVKILGRASKAKDGRPAVEAVKSGALHLLEWWSSTACEGKLDIVDRMCEAVVGGMLYADVAPHKELCIQLTTIAVRLDGRPDVSTRVIRAWEGIYEHLKMHRADAAAGPTGPVCSTIGCVSTDPAEMVCARCGIYYCSKSCQKSDWKSHKLFCEAE